MPKSPSKWRQGHLLLRMKAACSHHRCGTLALGKGYLTCPRPDPLAPIVPFKAVVAALGAQVGGAVSGRGSEWDSTGNSTMLPFPYRECEEFPLN